MAIELPGSPLEAVMSNEVWAEVYHRLAELIEAHRTTLVFVNTRRLAERVTHHLCELLGKQREHAVPMILITHDPDDLAACADVVVTLADGRVVDCAMGASEMPPPASPPTRGRHGVIAN